MSNITSAGNLSINQSLSVGGDTVIGTNGSNILTCNSTPTLNNGLTINGDINQNSTGTIKSGSGGVISNGDVLISNTKKFTSGTGLCTFNGPIQCNQNANLSSLTNTGTSTLNNVTCTSLTNTGSSNLNNVTCISLTNTGSSNLANVNCGGLTCTSLTNTGSSNFSNITTLNCTTLNTSMIEIGPITSSILSYIDMKTAYGNSDYDCRLSVVGGNLSIAGQGSFAIDSSNIKVNTSGLITSNGITNNGVLNQNNASNFSNNINAPSITSSTTFFCGSPNNFDTTALTNPKIINGISSGTADGFSYTNFNLAINSWYSVGFVYSNQGAPSVCKLIINNRTGDLNTQGNLTCNSINTSNVNLNYTTLPSFSSSMIGYQNIFYVSLFSITSGVNYTLNTFTLPMGVWHIEIKILFYALSNLTINNYTVSLIAGSTNIIFNLINTPTIINSTTSTYNTSSIYQNPSDTSVTFSYTQQSYTCSGLQILGNASDKSFVKITRIA